MGDDDNLLKYALYAAGAFVVWKFVLAPRVAAQGDGGTPLLLRRISEASLRRQYIVDNMADGQAHIASLPAGDPGIQETAGRMATLQAKLEALAHDFAAANNGAAIPALNLADPGIRNTYIGWLQSQGWKDPAVGVT